MQGDGLGGVPLALSVYPRTLGGISRRWQDLMRVHDKKCC